MDDYTSAKKLTKRYANNIFYRRANIGEITSYSATIQKITISSFSTLSFFKLILSSLSLPNE